ncbi:amino acid transporter [Meredithblackwellia eburnea MCA 4105]
MASAEKEFPPGTDMVKEPQAVGVTASVDFQGVVRTEDQQIKKDLSPAAIIGLGYVICNSWAGVAATLTIGLVQGGTVLLLYGFLFMFLLFSCIALSLAELVSAYPTAGGQYHWACYLAPTSKKREWAFITGFFNVASWIAIIASVCLQFAQYIIAAVIVNNPDFVIKSWHYFLLFQSCNVIITAYCWFGIHKASYLYQVGLFWSISLFFITFFSIVCGPGAMQGTRSSSAFVWTTFTNEVGWASNGIVFLTGLANVNYAWAGLDGTIHLAEDLKRPERDVPKALLATIVIGLITAFPWLIGALYSIQDFASVSATATGLPLIEMMLESLKSPGGVTTIITLMLVNVFISTAGCVQSAGRLTWSFAVDGGLIGANRIGWLDQRFNCAPYALLFNFAWIFLIGCLYLASTAVYNAIVGSCLILGHITYAVPVALLMYNGRKLPRRPYLPLGAFGWVANSVVVFWAIFITVIYSFPAVMPVTGSNMNYCSVVVVVVLLMGMINWFSYGKKHFSLKNIEALMRVD